MDKLVIKPNTRMAKFDAAGAAAADPNAELQYGPEPTLIFEDGSKVHFIGLDFANQLRGKKFDEIQFDERINVKKLKMAQQQFFGSLLK